MRPPPASLRQLLSRAAAASEPVECALHAWVKSARAQKKHGFITCNDGSTAEDVQVVTRPDVAAGATHGSCISVSGKLQPTRGKGQQRFDLVADELDVIGQCDSTYPIQKKDHTPAFLRKHVHLRPRSEATRNMLRVRDACSRSVFECLRELEFYKVEPPILTTADCEGGSAAFRVDAPLSKDKQQPFFDQATYLSVSSQLYLESLAASLGRVFTLSPAFRAERSLTSRHLSEFWMLEAELSFTTALEQVMHVAEACVHAAANSAYDLVYQHYRQNYKELIEHSSYSEQTAHSLQQPFARMTYTEAIDTLQKRKDASIEWGKDLNTEQERWLAEDFTEGPVFVTDYPAHLKPFYMRANTDSTPTRKTVACFDLIVPRIGELAGGSLREERFEHLSAALDKHKLDRKHYEWYLDLRRYGSSPHGGFGLGWERMISLLTGIENVRECIAFPRGSEGFHV